MGWKQKTFERGKDGLQLLPILDEMEKMQMAYAAAHGLHPFLVVSTRDEAHNTVWHFNEQAWRVFGQLFQGAVDSEPPPDGATVVASLAV